jgi:hypothetical protein
MSLPSARETLPTRYILNSPLPVSNVVDHPILLTDRSSEILMQKTGREIKIQDQVGDTVLGFRADVVRSSSCENKYACITYQLHVEAGSSHMFLLAIGFHCSC